MPTFSRPVALPAPELLAALRTVPAFAAQPEAVCHWFLAHAEARHYPVGASVFEAGRSLEHLLVVLHGRFEVFSGGAGPSRLLATHAAGALTGLLPFSRMVASEAGSVVREPVLALALHRDCFVALAQQSYSLMQALVGAMTDRVRAYVSAEHTNARLAALGKLSAGMAHELNNPAAALVRAAGALRNHLDATPEAFGRIMALEFTPAEVAATEALYTAARGATPPPTPIEQYDAEAALEAWLTTHAGADAVALASALAAEGLTAAALAPLGQALRPVALGPALAWLAQALGSRGLVGEVEAASRRVSALVGTLKEYTQMDRPEERAPLNLPAGLAHTLALLAPRLAAQGVAISQDFSEGLPAVWGYTAGANQVWMALLENALDALPAQGGHLQLSARHEPPFVVVRVADNGAGMAPEVLARIFDPFFTTKPPGRGQGLGLDTARRLLQAMGAELEVEASAPGAGTAMAVRFAVQ